MSEGNYTPGPWLAAEAISSRVGLPVVKAGANGGRLICNVNHVCDPLHGKVAGDDAVNREALANARLIAAAPDLLKAVKLFISEHDNTYDGQRLSMEMTRFIDLARSAVAKAEGAL